MRSPLDGPFVAIWQTVGNHEFETDGKEYTGWCRDVDGRTVDGRWPQTHQSTGLVRDFRTAFPDGRTQMRADELPAHWLGYVADDAANLGIEAFEGRPGFISDNQTVYAAPAHGREATLQRRPEEKPSFDFRLPRGKEFGGRSTFWVAFPNFYS